MEVALFNFLNYDSDIRVPVLIRPDGNSDMQGMSMEIEWDAGSVQESLKSYVEIFFTNDFQGEFDSNWVLIASVPAHKSSFLWKYTNRSATENGRIAIRSALSQGRRSQLSLSNSLRIYSYILLPPVVLSPVPENPYGKIIPFEFRVNENLKRIGVRSHYRILYSSRSLDIDWTTLWDKIPVTQVFFNFDASELTPADDYRFQIYITDGNNRSLPVIIDGIQVKNKTSFLIDTVPPSGNIRIVDNDGYTKYRDVLLRFDYYDKTTDVQSITILEQGSEEGSPVIRGPKYSPRDILSYTISGEEGQKILSVEYEDIAGNIVSSDQNKENFRTFFNNDDKEISVFYMPNNDSNDIWIAYNDDEFSLFHNRDRIESLHYPCTSLIKYNGAIYIGLKQMAGADWIGALSRYDGRTVSVITDFAGSDSFINSFISYAGQLYMGLESGDLYVLNGTVSTKIASFGYPINRMGTDGISLFIGLRNSMVLKVVFKSDDEYIISDNNMEI